MSSIIDGDLRIRSMNPHPVHLDGKCVLYWMQRTQRGRENEALNHAIEQANSLKLPIICAFSLYDQFPNAERRHFRFMIQGLIDASRELSEKNVPFIIRFGHPPQIINQLVTEIQPALIVSDENPLKIPTLWRESLAQEVKVAFHLVDSDVVIPTRHFIKEEYAARTIRPKIHKVLASYLKPVPNPKANHACIEGTTPAGEPLNETHLMSLLNVGGASEIPAYKGGSVEAHNRLKLFITKRLSRYSTERNEPTPYMTSELSAHLHFGNIDPINVVLKVLESGGPQSSIDSYIEEFIVRRELAINYCLFNPNYDSLKGCPDWALKTLAKHKDDPRTFLYTFEQLERGESHDPLWNASQKEMVLTGRMHNYMRMYWAKKILEWSPDAETAFETTLKLNDRWEMDGRDANGYTGVAWAIGGKHDRPWGERAIFGMVRFMSYESTRKKFDSQGYIEWVAKIEKGTIKRD